MPTRAESREKRWDSAGWSHRQQPPGCWRSRGGCAPPPHVWAETILDFVQLLLTDPARRHYLREFVLSIVPLQNPDRHEWLSWYNLDVAAGGSGQACTKPSIDGEAISFAPG